MNLKSRLLVVSLSIAVVALTAVSALAAPKVTVGTCKGAQYPTIQSAVTASAPGTEIVGCAGTYVKQVSIPATKNNLTLRSEKPLAAIIQAPALMTGNKAIVNVVGAQNVSIRGFTITGPGGGICDSIRYGVRVDSGGSATIRENHIAHIRDNPFSGCQNGVGILVGRASESTTGRAIIEKNLIDDYQKGGIVVSNTGSDAEVRENEVTGVGPTAAIAQNGIQISGGATATVEHNTVTDNVYTPQTVVSTGILLFSPGDVTIDDNEASSNDVSIYAEDADDAVISHNKLSDNVWDGIDLVDTTGAIVEHNASLNNGYDGIYVDSSATGNTLSHNRLRGNDLFDAEDQSVGTESCGTGNTWSHNQGDTDNTGGCLVGG